MLSATCCLFRFRSVATLDSRETNSFLCPSPCWSYLLRFNWFLDLVSSWMCVCLFLLCVFFSCVSLSLCPSSPSLGAFIPYALYLVWRPTKHIILFRHARTSNAKRQLTVRVTAAWLRVQSLQRAPLWLYAQLLVRYCLFVPGCGYATRIDSSS